MIEFIIICILGAIVICILPYIETFAHIIVPLVCTLGGAFLGVLLAAGFNEFIDEDTWPRFLGGGAIFGLLFGFYVLAN